VKRVRLALCAAALLALSCANGSSPFAPKPAWKLPPPPAPETPVVPAGKLHRATLDNGLRILILEDPRLPRVMLGVAFRRGESSLAPEEAGLASFTADLMERGAGDRDALAIAEATDRLGATLSVAASWDSLVAVTAGLSRDQDALLDLLADVVRRPRFDPAEAARSRSETLAALERARNDPNTLTSWYIAKAVYEGHRFGLPLSGTPETVAHFDAARARAFHARIALPNDAIFFASGDVQAAALIEQVRERFGTSWAQGTVMDAGAPPPAPAPPARRIVIVDRPEMVQARIALSHDGISRSSDDRIPVSLMNSVIGGSGFSSRLMETLRTSAGLTYSVGSDFAMRRSPGPFVASTFTVVPETRKVVDLVIAELERGRTEPPGEEDLTWARSLAIGNFAMGLETSAAVLQSLVDLDVYGLPEDSLDTFRSRVRAVTPEDVARVAQEYLHPDRAAIVIVGPASQIEPQLEGLGTIEVVKP
jgi:zinc protease